MAEVISRAGIDPVSLKRLEFILLAPKDAIDNGTFSKEMNKASIQEKVKKRVKAYEGSLDGWYNNHFATTLENIHVHTLSWESTLKWISDNKPEVADKLSAYYELCLKYK
ncbi:MAG: hypothetical protein E4H27_07480 [Anaerolineales bacterium]|nr:MAG: hypothetical protein E4H27_07480 [Anaerolineales bacterium]